MNLRNVPTRLAAGAFILHSGIEKWSGGPEQAAGIHGMAAGAFAAPVDAHCATSRFGVCALHTVKAVSAP